MRQVAIPVGQQGSYLCADDIVLPLHGFRQVLEQIGQARAGFGAFRQQLDSPLPTVCNRSRVELRLQARLLHDLEQFCRSEGNTIGQGIVVLIGRRLGSVDKRISLALDRTADRAQLLVHVVLDLGVAMRIGQIVSLPVEDVGVTQPVVRQLIGGMRNIDADVLFLRLAQQRAVVNLLGELVGTAVAAPRLIPASPLKQVVGLIQIALDCFNLRHLFRAQQFQQAVPGNGVVAR